MSTGVDNYTTLITTPQQRKVIERLMFEQLIEGGIVLAQVFPDGLRVKVMTPAQAQVLKPVMAQALGHALSPHNIHSAFQKPGGAKP